MKEIIRVTVYRCKEWLDEPERREEYFKYNGTVLDYNISSPDVIGVINDNGILDREFRECVQFHVDDISGSENKPLIPEGTDVIVNAGRAILEYQAKFLRFVYGDNNNYEWVIVLNSDGDIKKIKLENVRFLLPEEEKGIENGNPIQKRLESI